MTGPTSSGDGNPLRGLKASLPAGRRALMDVVVRQDGGTTYHAWDRLMVPIKVNDPSAIWAPTASTPTPGWNCADVTQTTPHASGGALLQRNLWSPPRADSAGISASTSCASSCSGSCQPM